MAKGHYTTANYIARRSVGYLIKRMNSLSMPRIDRLFDNADLSFSHWIVLITLRDGVAETCADIARHMSHDSGATTRLIDQLETRGFVLRERSKEDRRVIKLSLTPSGRAAVKELTPRVVAFWNSALEDFSAEEFETLLALLTRLVARIEREPETPSIAKPKRQAAQ